jgi:hypothetical protein
MLEADVVPETVAVREPDLFSEEFIRETVAEIMKKRGWKPEEGEATYEALMADPDMRAFLEPVIGFVSSNAGMLKQMAESTQAMLDDPWSNNDPMVSVYEDFVARGREADLGVFSVAEGEEGVGKDNKGRLLVKNGQWGIYFRDSALETNDLFRVLVHEWGAWWLVKDAGEPDEQLKEEKLNYVILAAGTPDGNKLEQTELIDMIYGEAATVLANRSYEKKYGGEDTEE